MSVKNLIKQAEKSTGLKFNQIVKYALIVLAAMVVLGIGQHYITVIIGVAYPAFMSCVTLMKKDPEEEKQWLTYWIVFGIFQMVDQFAGWILFIIPFYYVIKMSLLIALFHPSTRGATYVYNNYLRGYFLEMDQHVTKYQKMAEAHTNDLIEKAKDLNPLKKSD